MNSAALSAPVTPVSEWELKLLSHVDDPTGGFLPLGRPAEVVALLGQAREVRVGAGAAVGTGARHCARSRATARHEICAS